MIIDILISGIFVVALISGTVVGVLKWLLPLAWRVYDKNAERAHNRELAELVSKLQVQADSLIKSAEIAAKISDANRGKTIEATLLLWKSILDVERKFSPLTTIVTLLTKEEMLAAIRSPEESKPWTRSFLFEHLEKEDIKEILLQGAPPPSIQNIAPVGLGIYPHGLSEQQIFVQSSSYELYHIITSIFGRLAFIVIENKGKDNPIYWTEDRIIEGFVLHVLSPEEWEIIKGNKSGFRNLILVLKTLFIEEAKKDMRGIGQIANHTSDMYKILQSAPMQGPNLNMNRFSDFST